MGNELEMILSKDYNGHISQTGNYFLYAFYENVLFNSSQKMYPFYCIAHQLKRN